MYVYLKFLGLCLAALQCCVCVHLSFLALFGECVQLQLEQRLAHAGWLVLHLGFVA